jgi:biopolymer transport protein ExbD
MSKFRQNKSKEMPGVSTASLPDIVFTVLAFFVVVSSMKQSDLKITLTKPSAKEIIQLDKNEEIDYINAGIPKNSAFGNTVRLQLDDEIVPNFLKIRDFIDAKREPRSPLANDKATVSIKADKDDVDMDVIDKIENELREKDALRINYSTQKETR